MIHLYRPGSSILHRAPASSKLTVLAAMALALSLYPHDVWSAGVSVLAACGLYAVAGFGPRVVAAELWRLRWIVLVLGVALTVFVSPAAAWISVGRLIALLLLASLLTLTTRMTDLLAVLGRLLRPLRRLGIDADAVAITLGITITMIPVVAGFAHRVREAQQARGVKLGVRAVVPLMVLALRHADDVGDALAARGIA